MNFWLKSKTKIIVVLDNFASHRANDTKEYAEKNGIELIYLPPYSPDLNPIEFIWKSIKKVISREFIIDIDHMRDLIHEKFMECSSKISFAKRWIEKFLSEKQKSKMLGV
ncbi:transposase [Methanococcoides seepicolus]|uniref:Transposase n=1 Tax=Methanococcoides seepicolus TaxID=2828780 RepID=A0A9E4ZIA5_9EURY|nr:transposase [Methanococcoides seepicolus]